ncbi:DUF4394 domain-containing protein [Roseomonas sp. BN140053]|uniref:DUF4394 domain-containing protein n=1 Tax=Roseomonas sp. BN140053 TaxID=3391898 RepID=UPI0039EC61FB
MSRSFTRLRSALPAVLAAGAMLAAGGAGAATLVGLTADNHLVRIDTESRRAEAPVAVRGAEGRLLGIDVRPSDGKLYGVTDSNQIVTLDPGTGAATAVSRLSMPFQAGGRATVDFNPVADRLRLMGQGGMNFRINVATGEVSRDGELKNQPGSPGAGNAPRVVAGAYTNSVAGTQATALFTVDTGTRQLNLQAPPNDGVQQPKGEIAATLPAGVAFDILADGQGGNAAFLLAGAALHGVNLDTGRATLTGQVTGLPASEVIDIAAMR